MSNSTATFDPIVQSQSGKEVTANAFFDAVSPASFFGRRQSTSSGLTWGYYGGTLLVDGVLTQIANGTLALTASATNYLEITRAGAISKNVVGFTAGNIPLYLIVTGASTVTSYTDYRQWVLPQDQTSNVSVAITSADVTLNANQARCNYLTTTGVLTGNFNIIVPNNWNGIVFCNNTGAFTTTFKTAAGAGIVVAQTKRAILYANGTDVVRVTPDT